MNIYRANKAAIKNGQTPPMTGRYLRLNFFNSSVASPGSPRFACTNILLVNIEGLGWIKLHEGEVYDLGANQQWRFEYDIFPNQFPSFAGHAPTLFDFELQTSPHPMQRLRENPFIFVDGTQTSLSAINDPLTIYTPPNFTAVSRQGLTPYAVIRRIRIHNNSGTLLNLSNYDTGTPLIDAIADGTVFDQEVRDSLYVSRGGGNATFNWQVFFEFV